MTALLLFPNVKRLALGNFIRVWHISFSLKVGSSCKAGSAGVRVLDGGGDGGVGSVGGCGLGENIISISLEIQCNPWQCLGGKISMLTL